jgi:hypothetical protein
LVPFRMLDRNKVGHNAAPLMINRHATEALFSGSNL